LLLITVYPLIFALSTSLRSYWLFDPDRSAFVGLDNYIALFLRPCLARAFFDHRVRRRRLVLQLGPGYGLALCCITIALVGVLRVLLVMPSAHASGCRANLVIHVRSEHRDHPVLASSLGLSVRWLSDVNTAMAAVIIVNVGMDAVRLSSLCRRNGAFHPRSEAA
jgi:ABC-type sugar transport system permease subunit